jgi:CheY-like chemotaxis protein
MQVASEIRGDPQGVIVVDDDPIIRDILRANLVKLEQDVYLASNGMEALRYAELTNAAMIILDLNMPVLNGLQTCERLRQLPGYETKPVIVLTGHDDLAAQKAALRVGATAFLTKPFQPIQMLDTLSRHLVIKPGLLAAVRRDAERATSISRLRPQGTNPPEPRGNTPAEHNEFIRAKRLLTVLRG